MEKSEYLKTMNVLGKELHRAENAKPYDPDAYNKVIDEINSTNSLLFYKGLSRRRPWFALASIIVLLIVLLVIVYSVLSLLYIKGS